MAANSDRKELREMSATLKRKTEEFKRMKEELTALRTARKELKAKLDASAAAS